MANNQRRGTSLQTSHNDKGVHARIEHVEEYSVYPSSEFLNQLNQINPNFVEQILQDCRDERTHRHTLENKQFDENVRVNTALITLDNRQLGLFSRGQWFGLVLALGLVGLAVYGLYLQNTTVAVTAILAIVGVLVVYVLRQQPKPQNPSKDIPPPT